MKPYLLVAQRPYEAFYRGHPGRSVQQIWGTSNNSEEELRKALGKGLDASPPPATAEDAVTRLRWSAGQSGWKSSSTAGEPEKPSVGSRSFWILAGAVLLLFALLSPSWFVRCVVAGVVVLILLILFIGLWGTILNLLDRRDQAREHRLLDQHGPPPYPDGSKDPYVSDRSRRNKDTGKIGIYAYQIKGFLKEAAEAANRFDKEIRNNLEKLSAYKKKIDQCVFIFPDWIDIQMPKGTETGSCQRPLRAQTAQGERVTLVNSETVPVGSTLEFEIKIMSKELLPYIEFFLSYGCLPGLGQWRNIGKGRFMFTENVETADPKKKPAELLKEISERAAAHRSK